MVQVSVDSGTIYIGSLKHAGNTCSFPRPLPENQPLTIKELGCLTVPQMYHGSSMSHFSTINIITMPSEGWLIWPQIVQPLHSKQDISLQKPLYMFFTYGWALVSWQDDGVWPSSNACLLIVCTVCYLTKHTDVCKTPVFYRLLYKNLS